MSKDKKYLVTTRTSKYYTVDGKAYKIDKEDDLLIIYADGDKTDPIFSLKLGSFEGIEEFRN